MSRIGAEREKADGIKVLYPNKKLHDRQVRVFGRPSRDLVLSVQGTVAYHTQVHHPFVVIIDLGATFINLFVCLFVVVVVVVVIFSTKSSYNRK